MENIIYGIVMYFLGIGVGWYYKGLCEKSQLHDLQKRLAQERGELNKLLRGVS